MKTLLTLLYMMLVVQAYAKQPECHVHAPDGSCAATGSSVLQTLRFEIQAADCSDLNGKSCQACDETMSGANDVDYRGCQTKTRSGKTCQKWTVQTPHKHNNSPSDKPGKGLGDHNFCRNPDNEPTIWCYTTSSTRWEYCDPKGLYTQLCTNCGCSGAENVDWKFIGAKSTPAECYTATIASSWCGKDFFVFAPGHCYCRAPTSPCNQQLSGGIGSVYTMTQSTITTTTTTITTTTKLAFDCTEMTTQLEWEPKAKFWKFQTPDGAFWKASQYDATLGKYGSRFAPVYRSGSTSVYGLTEQYNSDEYLIVVESSPGNPQYHRFTGGRYPKRLEFDCASRTVKIVLQDRDVVKSFADIGL